MTVKELYYIFQDLNYDSSIRVYSNTKSGSYTDLYIGNYYDCNESKYGEYIIRYFTLKGNYDIEINV